MGWTRKRPWSNAVPTFRGNIRFGSRLEADVYVALTAGLGEDERIFVHPRFPLVSIAPSENGAPLYFTPDFLIVGPKGWRVVEAKGRRSRDWERGRAAFVAAYGVDVEEVRSIKPGVGIRSSAPDSSGLGGGSR